MLIKRERPDGFLRRLCLVTAAILSLSSGNIRAEASLPFESVTEESQIVPVGDGSGCYLLKSSGYYILKKDGSLESEAAVHYFDHVTIDGATLDGYYYHDETGRMRPGDGRLVHLDTSAGARVFNGYYLAGNLGKLNAAPRIRYIRNAQEQGFSDGYYYFDADGRLVQEKGIHYVEMICEGRLFSGYYYFGGENASLPGAAGQTPEGFSYDSDGYIGQEISLDLPELSAALEEEIARAEGDWSVYVKELNMGRTLLINDRPMVSASLIKAFTMAGAFHNMPAMRQNVGTLYGQDSASQSVLDHIDSLIWDMIAASDNESFNEVVRLQSPSHDFLEGAALINAYLAEQGYADTAVMGTLHPSSSEHIDAGGANRTSAKDCGLLLERIYLGRCVSKGASDEMLRFLLEQEETWKIPDALPSGIRTANKTGENDHSQHDIAIVYGTRCTYVVCILSENCMSEEAAIDEVQILAKIIHQYLDG